MRMHLAEKTASRSLQSLALSVVLVLSTTPLIGCAGGAEAAQALEQTLLPGHEPAWYTQRLADSGYEVTSVNYEDDDYLEYEIVRGETSYEVQLEVDPESGTVAKVSIADNVWKATPTNDVLERNETTIAVPASTHITVKLDDYLDSGENQENDTFTMSVAEPVLVGEDVAIPVGTQIRGRVASVESARRPNKGGRLVLKADSLEVGGETVEFEGIVTAPTGVEGESSIKEDLKEIAAGAGIGALVGGVLGGGKGVLAGVLIGGGGTFAATKGEQIELPPDTPLIVELREPVRVRVSS